MAWTITHGPIPEGANVLHSCDNPSCVNPAHLFLGTQADNVRDCQAKGRRAVNRPRSAPVGAVGPRGVFAGSGESNGNARLDWDAVREIRARHSQGESQASLAREYGVGRSHVQMIVSGQRWVEEAS